MSQAAHSPFGVIVSYVGLPANNWLGKTWKRQRGDRRYKTGEPGNPSAGTGAIDPEDQTVPALTLLREVYHYQALVVNRNGVPPAYGCQLNFLSMKPENRSYN